MACFSANSVRHNFPPFSRKLWIFSGKILHLPQFWLCTIYFESATEISWLTSCSTFVKVWMTGFCWRIWPSLLWNFSDGVFHLHYGPQSPSKPFIPLGVVEVLKKFEISIFWKKYYNIKFFKKKFLLKIC